MANFNGKVVVFGPTSFLAKAFIKDLTNRKVRFETIERSSNLDEYFLNPNEKNILVNFVYDRKNLAFNLKHSRKLISIANKFKALGIIQISTAAVYDHTQSGNINSSSRYSNIGDPYIQNKIAIENIFNKYSRIPTILLQPSIIFGAGGQWDSLLKFISNSHSELYLPYEGQSQCNYSYDTEISTTLLGLIIFLNSNNGTMIFKKTLCSHHSESWSKVFKLTFDYKGKIKACNMNIFHESDIKNFVSEIIFNNSILSKLSTLVPRKKRLIQIPDPVFFPSFKARIAMSTQFTIPKIKPYCVI